MRTRLAFAVVVSCCAALAIACAPAGEKTDDSAGGTTATPSGAPTTPLALADVAGKWNMVAVPASGTDTTSTLSVLVATADTMGWSMTFPNRDPIHVHVRAEGDSLITVSAPYESVRRPGVQVTTTTVSRLQNGILVGTSVARYKTTGADSVIVFRTRATKAP